ncbi:hypothetical protein [Ureibacillus chungkukjangi]|uniref:hypothetical protein n=1 Tax=Ureibacillus chungkukjangi TaxID=1202712 RepID=UPI000D33250A|nr:hypothetical protein [Ureibacillus chungkukjangi]MCM3389383.1 hypothetical protein [Ureibacillus chungkukjangi]
MVGLFNLGSLILGLVAWILPIINLLRYQKHENKNWFILSIVSVTACAFSLSLQIFYNYHLVKIEDWAALMDTTGGVVMATIVLLFSTVILNAVTLMVYRNRMV